MVLNLTSQPELRSGLRLHVASPGSAAAAARSRPRPRRPAAAVDEALVHAVVLALQVEDLEDVARGHEARHVRGQRAPVLAPLDGAAVALLGEALEARLATDVDDLLGGHHVCKGKEGGTNVTWAAYLNDTPLSKPNPRGFKVLTTYKVLRAASNLMNCVAQFQNFHN